MFQNLILIYGNRFLINKTKIRLLFTKNSALTEKIRMFIC